MIAARRLAAAVPVVFAITVAAADCGGSTSTADADAGSNACQARGGSCAFAAGQGWPGCAVAVPGTEPSKDACSGNAARSGSEFVCCVPKPDSGPDSCTLHGGTCAYPFGRTWQGCAIEVAANRVEVSYDCAGNEGQPGLIYHCCVHAPPVDAGSD